MRRLIGVSAVCKYSSHFSLAISKTHNLTSMYLKLKLDSSNILCWESFRSKSNHIICYIWNEPGRAFPTILHVRSAKTDEPAHLHSLNRISAEPSVGSQEFKASSNGADAQADLSLFLAQIQSCRKCCAPAQMVSHQVHITWTTPFPCWIFFHDKVVF